MSKQENDCTDLKKRLSFYLEKKDAKKMFARYSQLSYPHLRDRYAWFVSTGRMEDSVDIDLIFDKTVRKRAKKGMDLRHDVVAHRNVLLILEIEAEKMTALRFANAVFAGRYAALDDIFLFHDKKGRYKELWEQFVQNGLLERESEALA